MTTTFERLLGGLPAYFDRDPYREPGLSLSYDGTGVHVTIVGGVLTLSTSGGTLGNATTTFYLAGHTLTNLNTLIAATPGITATVVGDGSMSALSLIETDAQDIQTRPRLDRYSSMLWDLLMVSATSLLAGWDNAAAGLRQMNLRTADGKWVDLWGEEYYGGIYRKPGESDRDYAERIIKEVLRSRLNGKAIEAILEEECNADVTVTNLHDLAWVVGVTKFGYLVGRKYARTTFEIVITGVCEDLARLIERYRASGTLPFIEIAPLSEATFLVLRGASFTITPQSGTAIHLTGAQAADHLFSRPTGVLGGGPTLFTLGSSPLGGTPAVLGGNLPGIAIDDVWSNPP